jgi:hypothetical protein
MAYGLRIKDAGGATVIDESSKINRQRYSKETTLNETDSISLSDISGLSTALVSIMINPPDIRSCPHRISLSGTTLSWSPAAIANINNCASLIGIFIYV